MMTGCDGFDYSLLRSVPTVPTVPTVLPLPTVPPVGPGQPVMTAVTVLPRANAPSSASVVSPYSSLAT